ncbi:MAG: YlbF family regulator [Smithella sp.]
MGMDKLSLVEKARSLAKTLASSEEFEEYYTIQHKLKNDPEARSILEEFDKKQQELNAGLMQGKERELFNEMTALQDKIRANETIMIFLQAEQNVIAMIRDVNEVITREAGFDFGQNASANSAC